MMTIYVHVYIIIICMHVHLKATYKALMAKDGLSDTIAIEKIWLERQNKT